MAVLWGDDMKQKISICVISAFVMLIGLSVFLSWDKTRQKENPKLATEIRLETESKSSEDLLPIMHEQEPEPVEVQAEFLLFEEDGRISVFYEKDQSLFMETGIPVWYLPKELQLKLQDGIPFATEEELYEFLESYSS